MQHPTISIVLNLFLLSASGPSSRESTILPAPKDKVPHVPALISWGYIPPTLSPEPIDPKIESKAKNARLKRFPKFKTIVDNPWHYPEHGNIVVVVAGDPRERETWSESARKHFGQGAFIFNDLFSVNDLAKSLARFPEGSVDFLVFGGHGEFCDGGVFMGIKNASTYVIFGEHINVENLMSTENKVNRATMIRSMAKGGEVQFHVCVTGQERNLLNFAEAFQRRCWANPGDVGDWGVGQYPWFFKDPLKRK